MPLLEFIQQTIYSLAVALFLVYCSTLPRRSLFLSSMLFLLLILAENFIPLYRGSSLVEIFRGAIGDVSLTSGILMVLIILNQFDLSDKRKPVLNRGERLLLFILGSVLYLSTFGLISFDLYHLGYFSLLLILIIASIIMGLLLFNRRFAYAWLIALIGFYCHWQASNNLWDYLYDPLLWLVLAVDNLALLLRGLAERKLSQPIKRWD